MPDPVHFAGNLPKFPQRDIKDLVDPSGKPGEYSNSDVHSTTQLLQDAPLKDTVSGEGDQPGDVAMSRAYTGKDDGVQPMADPGLGEDTGVGTTPLEWNGVPSAKVLDGGHEPRTTEYSNYSNQKYDGLGDQNHRLLDPGSDRVVDGEGDLNYQKSSLSAGATEDPGTVKDVFQPKAWQGLPSARAL